MALTLGLREWGHREYWAGLRGVLGLTRHSTSEGQLKKWFATNFNHPAFILNSGTSALQLALALLSERSPERDEVIVPALACPALTRAVIACGLRPRYADIGQDLNLSVNTIKPCINRLSLAVVMVHSYGYPADSKGIQKLCYQHGIKLIDDAAQRIDSAHALGTAGDFGIFSFAQSKNVVCGIDGSGGVLMVNSLTYLESLEARWKCLPVAAHRRMAWLEFALAMTYPKASYYVERLRSRQILALNKPRLPARINVIDAAIALPQLASLERRRQARIKLLKQYQLTLSRFAINCPQLISGSDPTYLARLFVQVDPKSRDGCRLALAHAGIASRLPYRLPTELAEAIRCPNAVGSAASLLELPLPEYWTVKDIELAGHIVAQSGTQAVSMQSRILEH